MSLFYHAVTFSAHSFLCGVALDIDDFKAINDTFGHEGGDEAIKTFAKVLTGNVRSADDAIRL